MYKRQVSSLPASVVTSVTASVAISASSVGFMPVSYTHLDVYKRQDFSFASYTRGGSATIPSSLLLGVSVASVSFLKSLSLIHI